MPPKKKSRTEEEATERWYAVDLKKKAKQINLPVSAGQVKALNEALSLAGGKLENQRSPICLTTAGKGLEARVVTLSDMQTHGPPGWWQISSQYAAPEDAKKRVLVQQQREDDVQGKRPWRLLVRESVGGELATLLLDPTRQDWELPDLVRSSAALVEQAQTIDADMKPTEEAAKEGAEKDNSKGEVDAAKDAAAVLNGLKEEKQADGEKAEKQPEEDTGPKELEADAPEDKREKLKDPVTFLTPDTTMNVMQSGLGNILMTLNEGGLQYLLAGARASVGLKSGRYMFEARIVENLNQFDNQANMPRSPVPRNLLRVGVSLSSGPPILGDNEDSICFDSEGNLVFNRKRSPVAKRFNADNNVAVVINLYDDGSPNASTISLFKDGERACDPQPLPDNLKGKVLYPSVTFKNVSVHVHFGPWTHVPLPFACRTVQEAAVDDVVVTSYPAPADGKHEVVFPVMLPDEGTFDWLDWYIKRNPQYTELSERMIMEWALRSGLWRPKSNSFKASMDKPDMNFGIPHLDDGSVKNILQMAATVQQRDFIVMEVKGNLMKQERAEALERFNFPYFRKVARVMMGEPSTDYKEHLHSSKLAEKQAKADAELRAKKQERARKRIIEFRQKQVEKARKRAEKIKKKQEELKRKREEAEKKAAEAGEEATENPEEKQEAEEAKEEEEEEEEEEETEPKEDAAMEEELELPKVELTEAEKRDWFAKKPGSLADVSSFLLGQVFSKFSLPEEGDGFDEIKHDWQTHEGCLEHIRRWNLDRKIASRVDDLSPSDWFREKWHAWQRDLSVWHQKHQDYKDPNKRPMLVAAAQREKAELEAALRALEASKKSETDKGEETNTEEDKGKDKENGKEETGDTAEKKEAKDAKEEAKDVKMEDTKDGKEGKDAGKTGDAEKTPAADQKEGAEKAVANGQGQGGDKIKEESKEGGGEKEKKPEDEEDPIKALVEEVRAKEVDLFSLNEIHDANTGEPLYSNFAFEDWALLSLRFELHLLCHSFRRDCNDPDRTGIHPDHLAFYYNRYYKKGLNPKNYGVDSVEELMKMIRDTVAVCMKVIESQITDDLENNEVFVKLTEESRRDRQRRLDSGDQSAKLHFSLQPQHNTPPVFIGTNRTGLRPSAMGMQIPPIVPPPPQHIPPLPQQFPAPPVPQLPPGELLVDPSQQDQGYSMSLPVPAGVVQRPPVRLSIPPVNSGKGGFVGGKGPPPQQQWGSQSWYAPRSSYMPGGKMGRPSMMSRSGPYQGGWRYR